MGTEVAYQDDELVEVECPEVPGRDAAPGRNERSCPGCFTIHAGECV
jgi:hypothetical protein